MKNKQTVIRCIALALTLVLTLLQCVPRAEAASGTKITGYNYPVVLSAGKSYTIKGVLSSSSKITSVTVGVYTQATGGTRKTGWTVNPNAKSYNLSRVASKVKFSSLPRGTYFYRITVTTTTQKNKVILLRRFTVK